MTCNRSCSSSLNLLNTAVAIHQRPIFQFPPQNAPKPLAVGLILDPLGSSQLSSRHPQGVGSSEKGKTGVREIKGEWGERGKEEENMNTPIFETRLTPLVASRPRESCWCSWQYCRSLLLLLMLMLSTSSSSVSVAKALRGRDMPVNRQSARCPRRWAGRRGASVIVAVVMTTPGSI